jgi:hypothetical protein
MPGEDFGAVENGGVVFRALVRSLPKERGSGQCGRIGFGRARLCYGGRVVPGCRSKDTHYLGGRSASASA